MPLAKFSTLGGGCFIEQRDDEADYSVTTRCFRFDAQGRAEYALYGDLTGSDPAPRWYGSMLREADFILA